MDWFLYDIDLCHERIKLTLSSKGLYSKILFCSFVEFILSNKFYTIKPNHLVHIAPSRNGSQISAECHQKLFLSELVLAGDFYQ